MNDLPTVPCELCGTPTRMTGTQRCDLCWELERRIDLDPSLAIKILARMGKLSSKETKDERTD